jgi:hypothetical protein
MSATEQLVESFDDATVRCWCCGHQQRPEQLVHLGSHPEVVVCLGCAHFLHQRARAREDELRPSLGGRGRDVLRSARMVVMNHGWHNAPVVGRVLRWLGPRLP